MGRPPASPINVVVFLMFVVGLILSSASQVAARDDKRVALVVGNGAYQNTAGLTNPANDAEDMAAALRRVGFEVIGGRDLDKRAMDAALTAFARLAQEADVALFYFAGHGLQHQGQNYLLPVDVKLEDEFGLQFETTRVEDVLQTLSRARGVRMLILDACRNNPLASRMARASTRAFGRGLAPLERTQGMLVAYATQTNDVAFDGADRRNSFFTGALVREIEEPGLEVGQLFRRVIAAVHRETQGRQTPEVSISLLGEFYFSARERDTDVWTRLRGTNDAEALKAFIAQYPNSLLVDAARARIELLERTTAEGQRRRLEREAELRRHAEALEAERKRVADELARLAAAEAEAARPSAQLGPAEAGLLPGTGAPPSSIPAAQPGSSSVAGSPTVAAVAPGGAVPPARPPPTRLSPPAADPPLLADPPPNRPAEAPSPAAAATPGPTSAATLGPLAALPPAVERARESSRPDGGPTAQRALVAAIQRELQRVGCFSGAIGDAWSAKATTSAVAAFARHAGLSRPEGPSPDFLEAVRDKGARVCPIVCAPMQVAREGRCVARTCPAGQALGRDGTCVPQRPQRKAVQTEARQPQRPAAAPRARPAAPRSAPATAAPRGCFVVQGQRFCE
jgi:uncharacterized caspase-like protein